MVSAKLYSLIIISPYGVWYLKNTDLIARSSNIIKTEVQKQIAIRALTMALHIFLLVIK